MDIQALKLDIVERIIRTEKPELLNKIYKLLRSDKTEDWWDSLPEEIQKSILEGERDVERGNVFSHEEIIREARHKYGF